MGRRGLLLTLGLTLVLHTGCWFGTGSTADIRWQVSEQTGMRLEPEFGMRAGRITMGLARFGLKMAGEDEISLRGISKIEVGVYKVAALAEEDSPGIAALEFPGWTPVVRVRNHGEQVLVLLRPEQQRIRALMVLVHDEQEFVVVRAKGKIHRFLQRALERHGWGEIHGAFHDSLDG